MRMREKRAHCGDAASTFAGAASHAAIARGTAECAALQSARHCKRQARRTDERPEGVEALRPLRKARHALRPAAGCEQHPDVARLLEG
eukprot:2611393-Prymnesium_polylepis.1